MGDWIVLARVETERVLVRQRRTDLGESGVYRDVPRPVAMVWLGDGAPGDLEHARRWAEIDGGGWTVMTVPSDCQDPIAAGKRAIMEGDHGKT